MTASPTLSPPRARAAARPLRILQANATGVDSVGGVETVIRQLADRLRDRGHAVTQLFLADGPSHPRPDVWTMTLPAPTTWHRIPSPMSVVRMAQGFARLGRLLRAVRPDVVHFHYITWETVYFVVLKPVFGYRLVLTSHGSDLLRVRWPLVLRSLPFLLRGADATTVVSDELAVRAREILDGRGRPPLVVPNGVDTAFWCPDPEAPTTPGAGPPTVVSVGRFRRVKGHDVLLDAFAHVLQFVPDARLVLVGDGPDREALVGQAERLGVDGAVEFTGLLDSEGTRAQLRRATVFALPSRGEGLPVSLLEALATGVPAVASAVGGVPAVMAGGGGTTVPSEDPDALANALAPYLLDPDWAARVGREGRLQAREFDVGQTVLAYERVLSTGLVSS